MTIFILYIKNNHIITMDKEKITLDSSTSSITPSTLSRIVASHNTVDGTPYKLDEVISYNNTYDNLYSVVNNLSLITGIADSVIVFDISAPYPVGELLYGKYFTFTTVLGGLR